MGTEQLYDRDFYAWTLKNAESLRQGRLSEIDVEHLAEELETMGRSERRELINRLAVLVAHLLKWQSQPNSRGRSWQLTIKEQRRQTARVLSDNPSLKFVANELLAEAYGDAVIKAAKETGLDESAFPENCPFAWDEVFDSAFWPE